MADGIPFTPAPQMNMPNPLQTISGLESIAQRQQAMEQQQIAMQGKMAIGRHMQSAIDPATGKLDNHKFIAALSVDPAGQAVFADAYHMLLQNNEIDTRIAGQEIQNQSNRLTGIANMLTPLQRKVAEGQPISESDLSGAIAMGINNGAFKSREEGLQALTQWAGVTRNNPNAAKDIVLNLSQFTENARAALDKNMLSMEAAHKMIPMTSEFGTPYELPAYRVPGAMPPGAAQMQQGGAGFAPQENAPEAASAPREFPGARQEESPSAPPAAFPMSDLPPGAIRKGASPAEKQVVDYMNDTEASKHWLRKDIATAEDEANKAIAIETKLHQQVDLLKQFEQGPLMDPRSWTAEKLEGMGFPKSTINSLLGAKPGTKDAVAAAQAARKAIFEMAAGEAKQAFPNMSRFTNFDVQQALKGTPTLETKPEAAEIIFKHIQNAINIAKVRAEYVGKYGDWSVNNYRNKRAFNEHALESGFRDYLTDTGMYREGPVEIGGEK